MKSHECVDLVIGTLRCKEWIHMQALNCAKRGRRITDGGSHSHAMPS
jgi:hypothetical protein